MIPNITLMRDLVMIRPVPLHMKKTADGIIVPGDVDKMAPKRATVVAAGPGTYVKSKFVPNSFRPGDQILYVERELIPAKVEGEDYFILKAEDVIVKLGHETLPEETVSEMSDGAYHAETMRRAVIARLRACGLERVQDMLNPTETYVSADGESVAASARSYMVESVQDVTSFEPPGDAKAFAMYLVNFVELGSALNQVSTKVVVRLAFLPRADVTLG